MLLQLLLLLIGFALLVYSAHILIEGSIALAKKFKISELIIGLTIVGFGTSAPELAVSIISAIKKTGAITIGNVIGSNIMNIGIILGFTGIITVSKINKQLIKNDLPYLIIGTLLFTLLLFDNNISRIDGILLLLWFSFILYKWIKNRHAPLEEIEETDIFSNFKIVSFILIGIIGLVLGGEITVKSAIKIAKFLKISETVIALTIVAVGTSLPEIITSLIAVIKRKADIGVGNIIGSNIFNLLLCIGISSALVPITFDLQKNIVTITALLFFTIILYPFFLIKKKLTLSLGLILLLTYITYIIYLILNRSII